jgi:hypothetical protein
MHEFAISPCQNSINLKSMSNPNSYEIQDDYFVVIGDWRREYATIMQDHDIPDR